MLWDQISITRIKKQNCKKKKKTRRLNNTFLNNQQVTEEIKREIKKILEINDNGNITTQHLWDSAKGVLRGKFIAIQSYLSKQEKRWINEITLHLKQLEKEEQQTKQNPQN